MQYHKEHIIQKQKDAQHPWSVQPVGKGDEATRSGFTFDPADV